MVETEIAYISFAANILFFFIFYRLHFFWEKSGQKNFFIGQIKAAMNFIKGGILVVGATNDRALNLWFKGENDPIRPMSRGQGISQQYDEKQLFHLPKGMPALFSFQGFLSNSNPLETGNDDIELSQIAQANEVFVEEETKRKFAKQNPFDKIRKFQIVTVVLLLIGFAMIYFYINEFSTNIKSFKEEVSSEWEAVKPKVNKFLDEYPTINANLSQGVELS